MSALISSLWTDPLVASGWSEIYKKKFLEDSLTSKSEITSTPTQKSVLLATISSLSYPKQNISQPLFRWWFVFTCIGYESKVNLNLINLHVGCQLPRWSTFADALCHVVRSLNVDPTVRSENVLSPVVSASLAVEALPAISTHVPSPQGCIERTQLFTDGKTWEPDCREVEDGSIVCCGSFNAQLSRNWRKKSLICFHLKRKDFLEGESDSERNPEVLTNIAPQHSQVAIGSVEAWHLGWSFHKRVAEPSEEVFSYFCVTVGLRVFILHPICIVVQLGRVIWFRKVLDCESDVLWKVLSVVSVPFCVFPTLK